MKKQITRSLCCLLALLLCLGSAIYTPAAQDDQTQVSFTVTLATGKPTDYATLKVLDKDGKALELTDKGGGRYTFVMPAGKVTVKAVFMDDNTMLNFFTDVHAEDYYYDAVLWAAQKGITGGMSCLLYTSDAADEL